MRPAATEHRAGSRVAMAQSLESTHVHSARFHPIPDHRGGAQTPAVTRISLVPSAWHLALLALSLAGKSGEAEAARTLLVLSGGSAGLQ